MIRRAECDRCGFWATIPARSPHALAYDHAARCAGELVERRYVPEAECDGLREAVAALRSALLSGEPYSEQMQQLVDKALSQGRT